MFSSTKGESRHVVQNTAVTPSIIAESMSILGNLVGEGGNIEIQGSIEGNIHAHSVTVRESGYVKGDIVSENIVIAGKTLGLIKAKNVKLSKTARVSGVIMYEKLTIEDGALLDAQCKRFDSTTITQQYDHIEYTEEFQAPKVVRMHDVVDKQNIGIEELN
ncbi:MAG: polymer-forming cytoskeletal protein [Alphaproteobacteria bacterium]|nr:polymer-forming cytoskeletal protein [Alphaproteobacteria bacterium]